MKNIPPKNTIQLVSAEHSEITEQYDKTRP